MKQAFCENCRAYVDYKIIEKPMSSTLKGKSYTYIGKSAYCRQCNEEIYVAEINDSNLEALYDTYRKENHIISLEMIKEIPKKYDIGKRPLSLLLGWGELTFSRYCEGDIPTKQYSEILKKIYDEPEYYEEILETNKENLKSELAYNKSKRALEQLITLNKHNKNKIDLVADYILEQCEDITPLALQKMLYYIQGFYYAFNQQFIFDEDCEAWVHGPVYKEIYNKYRNYRFNPIERPLKEDKTHNKLNFSLSEQAVLNSIMIHLGCYSGKILEKFTHSEMPWIMTRGELAPDINSDRIISKALIGEYFTHIKEKYQMIQPHDIKNYTQALFEQVECLN